MKRFIFLLTLSLFWGSVSAQSTQLEAQASIDSLIPTQQTKAVTAAKLRFAFTKTFNYVKSLIIGVPETPEKYGAKGDGVTNDKDAFEAWLLANPKGSIKLLPNKSYKINGTLRISANGNGQSMLNIDGNGSKIITDNDGATPVIQVFQTKYLTLHHLQIEGLTDFEGMWESTIQECHFQDVKFGFSNTTDFDEFYWNRFDKCIFREVWLNTGTASDRTEFNSNSFYDCKIWFGQYGIRVFGDQLLQGVNFYNCDISYQTVSILYVDNALLDGSINFFGGYWDSGNGMPINSKGIVINTIGVVAPNSANATSFDVSVGSRQISGVYSGVRNGSRLPVSTVNLIRNGDFMYGTAGVYNSGMAMTVQNGSGWYGKYLQCLSNNLRYIEFEAISAPLKGTYTLTIVGRNKNNTVLVPVIVKDGEEVIYTPIKLRDDSVTDPEAFTVSSCNVELNQGQVFKFRMYTQEGVSNAFDLAYVGLTYGIYGVLYAPPHPLANANGSIDHSGIGIKTAYVSASVTTNTELFSIPVENYTRVSAELTCWSQDDTFPDGAGYSKHAITANRYTGAITSTLTPIISSKAGDFQGVPSISVVDAGGGVMKIKASGLDGAATVKCKLEGKY